ncbi:polysaccharide deacetylase family protein [Heliophilum fasciatum]|uniref:polysaccharide deacetylase family protein n=1 Tax=Heliophilum fasciatum TaxID=35700 RepID=UPI00104AA8F9|nr:polysaccharide deacetylase family protein [Heliophilum fasciatum]MCW2278441.1 peptidoglycan-N-acetylmuramic acid deacetylase [Heliophilum fasciatum]
MLILFITTVFIGAKGLALWHPPQPEEMYPFNFAAAPGQDSKLGWGFVRSKNEVPPYVPEWEKELLQAYDAVYMLPGDERRISLTFDMGYERAGATPRILDILDRHQVKATFFLTGHWVDTQPELLNQIAQKGHIIGNHTRNHPDLTNITPDQRAEEILSLHRKIEQTANYSPRYLRPPEGRFSRESLNACRNLGYQTVFWSISAVDWLPTANAQEIHDTVLGQLHPGAIILLHGNAQAVVDQLESLIVDIKARNYQFVPLSVISTPAGPPAPTDTPAPPESPANPQ